MKCKHTHTRALTNSYIDVLPVCKCHVWQLRQVSAAVITALPCNMSWQLANTLQVCMYVLEPASVQQQQCNTHTHTHASIIVRWKKHVILLIILLVQCVVVFAGSHVHWSFVPALIFLPLWLRKILKLQKKAKQCPRLIQYVSHYGGISISERKFVLFIVNALCCILEPYKGQYTRKKCINCSRNRDNYLKEIIISKKYNIEGCVSGEKVGIEGARNPEISHSNRMFLYIVIN